MSRNNLLIFDIFPYEESLEVKLTDLETKESFKYAEKLPSNSSNIIYPLIGIRKISLISKSGNQLHIINNVVIRKDKNIYSILIDKEKGLWEMLFEKGYKFHYYELKLQEKITRKMIREKKVLSRL